MKDDNPLNSPEIHNVFWYWLLIPLELLPAYKSKSGDIHKMREHTIKVVNFRDQWIQDTMDDRIGMI